MARITILIMAAGAATAGASASAAPLDEGGSVSGPAGACTVAAIQPMAPAGTTIETATPTAAPVPNCRIDGYVTTQNPGPNKVRFRLQLPDKGWTHRYYFIGMGAAAGYVPTDSQIPAGNPLYGGFAVAGTDTGHEAPMIDWGFLRTNAAQARDHIDRGAHVVALATQQITRRYYHADKMYRYHSGCSGGGRMGVMAIERHPEDYDGVLLGAPGGRSSATMLKFIFAAQQAVREPGAWVSPAKLELAEAKVTAACDGLDGAVDGIIADHRMCHFDFTRIQCKGADGPNCLTAPEIRTINALLEGPHGPKGKLTEGFPISNMSVWSGFTGKTPPPWSSEPTMQNAANGNGGYIIGASLAKVFFGPDYDPMTFDFHNQKDIDAWWAAAKRIDYGQPYPADLRGYEKAGGKVLFWNGVSDPCCSDIELRGYYDDAARKLSGGIPELERFASYYRVPGMAHCGGGTGPNDAPDVLLTELVDWVEKGQQPGPVIAHRGADRARMQFADPRTGTVSGVIVPPPAGASRDFLLCPDPQVATFNGPGVPGAVNEAANWTCKMPATAKVAAR